MFKLQFWQCLTVPNDSLSCCGRYNKAYREFVPPLAATMLRLCLTFCIAGGSKLPPFCERSSRTVPHPLRYAKHYTENVVTECHQWKWVQYLNTRPNPSPRTSLPFVAKLKAVVLPHHGKIWYISFPTKRFSNVDAICFNTWCPWSTSSRHSSCLHPARLQEHNNPCEQIQVQLHLDSTDRLFICTQFLLLAQLRSTSEHCLVQQCKTSHSPFDIQSHQWTSGYQCDVCYRDLCVQSIFHDNGFRILMSSKNTVLRWSLHFAFGRCNSSIMWHIKSHQWAIAIYLWTASCLSSTLCAPACSRWLCKNKNTYCSGERTGQCYWERWIRWWLSR